MEIQNILNPSSSAKLETQQEKQFTIPPGGSAWIRGMLFKNTTDTELDLTIEEFNDGKYKITVSLHATDIPYISPFRGEVSPGHVYRIFVETAKEVDRSWFDLLDEKVFVEEGAAEVSSKTATQARRSLNNAHKLC